MNDTDAIEGLKRLGLTTYEARVFLGLQKLGRGTASEVSDIADVPRSQVYGAADDLERRGLIETQQSTPTVYRPVSLEQARRQLLDRLAETGSETFDYLGTVQNTQETEEQTESIWVVRGRDSVSARAVELAERADSQLLYAIDHPALVTDGMLDAFTAAANRGTQVVLGTGDETMLTDFEQAGLTTFSVPVDRGLDVSVARLLVADDETLLLSTRTTDRSASADAASRVDSEEVAFWTSENAFASVLAELAEAWLADPFG